MADHTIQAARFMERIRQLEQQLAARPGITEEDADQMARQIADSALYPGGPTLDQWHRSINKAARDVLMKLVDRPSKEAKT